MTDKPTQLKPCPNPWCDGEAEDVAVHSCRGTASGSPRYFWVACASCDIDGPTCDTKDEAITAWNTRSGDATELLREARLWVSVSEHDEDCELHPDYGAQNLELANDQAEQDALDAGGDERDVRYRTHPDDAVCTCERGNLIARIDAHLEGEA